MNKPIDQSQFVTPTVTTGSLPNSSKVYTAPESAPDLRVPHRLVHLHETANEPDVPVYDTSGPYSDTSVTIDVEKGLASDPQVACAVLDSGVAVVLRDDGDLDVFRSSVGATSRKRIHATLSSDVHLRCHHGQLLGTRGTRAHRLTNHGQSTRQISQTNVVQT